MRVPPWRLSRRGSSTFRFSHAQLPRPANYQHATPTCTYGMRATGPCKAT
jgi:hypothetical protein